MKTKALVLFLMLLFIGVTPAVSRAEDGSGSATDALLLDLGLRFIENPGDFFFNVHSDNEDFSPLPAGKHGAVRFNFFPTFLPTTWANLNLKVNVLRDRGSIPQVDVVGTYGDLIGLRAASAMMEDVKPSFSDYSVGAVVSKAAAEKTRIFGGIKYSSVAMDIKFSSPVALMDGLNPLESLNFKVADTFFFTGISQQTGREKYVVGQVGYGLTSKKIVSRLMLSYRHLELGMDIFPEGLLVIHPFLAWHWFF